MMKYLLSALFVAVLATSSYAQHESCSKAEAYKHSLTNRQSPQAYPDLPYRPYDVISYDIKVDLRHAFIYKAPYFDGLVTITLDLLETTNTIDLDAAGMMINGLTINGEVQDPKPQPKPNETITINLPSKFREKGTRLTIGISYYRNSDENRGAYFYPKGYFVGLGPKPAEDSVFVEEDLFYTMCEPRNAHFWMPCNDQPDDKADCIVRVTVPSIGISVISNGVRSDSTSYGSYHIFSFYSDKPITTYLIAITASKFVTWDEMVPRESNPLDSIRLHYYAWQPDYDEKTITDGSKYNATNAFKNTKYMMTAFEKMFGPYPFLQYGQVPVQPFNFGGMEHQTVSTINRSWLRGNWSESGIAHELGHQWFGDKVTCETFKDLWLNEGFATFSEAIYNESWGGDEWYRNTIRGKANGYFNGENNFLPIYDPPEPLLFNGATIYNKAACVIHMLRRVVNDDQLFFSALTDYSDHFAFGNCNTTQFSNYMSTRLGRDLTEFFDQWIYSPLHPSYDIYWAQDANKMLYVLVNQIQEDRDHFTMPIRLFAYRRDGGIDTLNYLNNDRTQKYWRQMATEIDSIHFDRDLVILSEVAFAYDATISVGHTKAINSSFSAVLDHFTNEIVCKHFGGTAVEVYSMLGQKLMSRSGLPNDVIRLPAGDLPAGAYIIRSARESAKILIVR